MVLISGRFSASYVNKSWSRSSSSSEHCANPHGGCFFCIRSRRTASRSSPGATFQPSLRVSTSSTVMPKAQTSVAVFERTLWSRVSGALYLVVPFTNADWVRVFWMLVFTREMPKSHNFTSRRAPFLFWMKRMFWGLTSPWMMSRSCRYCKPLQKIKNLAKICT